MLLLPYLYDRQIGSIRKARSSDSRPNLDYLLSRLVCGQKDVFITWGESRVAVPPFTCKFRKDKESGMLAVANEDGEIYLIDTDRGKGVVKNFSAHHNAIFDLCWLPDKNRLLTGAGDYRSCLFDMSTCQRVSTYQFHTASVKSIDVCHGENGMTFAAGSKDGDISVWDIREKCHSLHCKPAIVITKAHARTTYNTNKRTYNCVHSSSSVSAVAFKDSNTLASAGVADSVIKIWDLRKTYVTKYDRPHQSRYQIKYLDTKVQGFGFTSLVFDSLYTKLYVCSTANKIFEMDCHSYTKKSAQFTGHKCSSYFIKISLSYDDQYLVSGSSDNKAYIWKTSKPGFPIFELPGHTDEVSAVAFGAYDNTKVATCGDDNKVFLWKTKYSDNAYYKYDKVVAASCPYSNVIAEDSSSDIGDTITIFQSVTLVKPAKDTPKLKSPPATRDIKNFFSPLTSTPSRPDKTSSSSDASTPQTSLCTQNGSSTQNEVATPIVQREPLSPRKHLQGNDAKTSSSSARAMCLRQEPSSQGKENGAVMPGSVESGSKPNGQLKRKLYLNDRFCKHHPDGCGRTRGHTRCGKRITIVPQKVNLKNYFSVSPE